MTEANVEKLRARLAEVPLFAGCHPPDVAIIAQRAEMRDVPRGTTLITAGDVGDEFFVLLSGTASVARNGTVVGELAPGAHFGELALLDPAPRSADIVMTSDGTISVFSRATLLLALSAIPELAPALLMFVARRLREADAASEREVM
jgi:CRP/FNR family transcriptional regulator, cyclic AMP receptor protein